VAELLQSTPWKEIVDGLPRERCGCAQVLAKVRREAGGSLFEKLHSPGIVARLPPMSGFVHGEYVAVLALIIIYLPLSP
jgi:hypothetical protein